MTIERDITVTMSLHSCFYKDKQGMNIVIVMLISIIVNGQIDVNGCMMTRKTVEY